jgi:hypothetical protein
MSFDYATAAIIDEQLAWLEKKAKNRARKLTKLTARAAEGRDVAAYMQKLNAQAQEDQQEKLALEAEAREANVTAKDRPDDYINGVYARMDRGDD